MAKYSIQQILVIVIPLFIENVVTITLNDDYNVIDRINFDDWVRILYVIGCVTLFWYSFHGAYARITAVREIFIKGKSIA